MANYKLFGKLHLALFRLTRGRIGGRASGIEMVMLDTIGRKTGQVRTVPIACYPYEGDITVVASNNGSDKDPNWWLNLKAHPQVELQLHTQRYQALAEEMSDAERDAHWPDIIKINPTQIRHQRISSRKLPVVRLRLLNKI